MLEKPTEDPRSQGQPGLLLEEETPDMFIHTRVYEQCVFCGVETKHWHQPTNTPICRGCGAVRSEAEIGPHKQQANARAAALWD